MITELCSIKLDDKQRKFLKTHVDGQNLCHLCKDPVGLAFALLGQPKVDGTHLQFNVGEFVIMKICNLCHAIINEGLKSCRARKV